MRTEPPLPGGTAPAPGPSAFQQQPTARRRRSRQASERFQHPPALNSRPNPPSRSPTPGKPPEGHMSPARGTYVLILMKTWLHHPSTLRPCLLPLGYPDNHPHRDIRPCPQSRDHGTTRPPQSTSISPSLAPPVLSTPYPHLSTPRRHTGETPGSGRYTHSGPSYPPLSRLLPSAGASCPRVPPSRSRSGFRPVQACREHMSPQGGLESGQVSHAHLGAPPRPAGCCAPGRPAAGVVVLRRP